MLVTRPPRCLPVSFLLVAAMLIFVSGCSGSKNDDKARAENSAPPDRYQTSADRYPEVITEQVEMQVAASDGTRSMEMRTGPRAPSTSVPSLETIPEVAAMESGYSAAASAEDHLSQLPAGARRSEQGFATIQVFYATDRGRDALSLSDYEITGQRQTFVSFCIVALMLILFAAVNWLRGRTNIGTLSAVIGCLVAIVAVSLMLAGQANIEKHGVTYNTDRGSLVRGVCEVTVPDIHSRGVVERPSLLRFEIRENQQEHIVLTSAVELNQNDFQRRLSETISASPDRDLLVFIHGYNVDFQSAVRRTAQVAVDLPFEGVPVCYSWPSQGSLFGYAVDETNAEWTTPHLKQFLLELASESGARSINVVAHSMGNRPMTAAMQQIGWQLDSQSDVPFDRIVLAAPDVDADRFRRDLAPSLLNVAHHVTLYASSDDQALIASKQVHGYPRAGESGADIVVVPGVETIDVSGIDLSLLGHSYYGDNESMLRDLYDVLRLRLPAPRRTLLIPRRYGELVFWQLAQRLPARSSPY